MNKRAFLTWTIPMYGGALDPYILNQDISKWHFSPHGAVQTAPSLSRRCLPCGIPLERAVRIGVSSANCRAKSHFQVRTAERNPIFRCLPLRCPPLLDQKNPRVRKIRVRNSGAGNGCANFMDTWKNAFFLQEKPSP